MSSPRRLTSEPEWAHECEAPSWASRSPRLRGTKALGLSYERRLARALPQGTLHGQWFIYRADGKVGYCQPDFLLRGKSELAVLEAKLTDIEAAWEQLQQLYRPVLEKCYDRRAYCIVVSRSLARCPQNAEVCETLKEAIVATRLVKTPVVLHWIGTGRI